MLNTALYELHRPGQKPLRGEVRLFEEVILGPYCLFNPRVIDFDRKLVPSQKVFAAPDEVDDGVEIAAEMQVVRELASHGLTRTDTGDAQCDTTSAQRQRSSTRD